MNLFTPDEGTQVKHLLSLFDIIETKICLLNKQRGRHVWERADGRKEVVAALKTARRQIDAMIRLMEKNDADRLKA